MRSAAFVVVLAGLGTLLVACGASSTPRMRVARDLGCTEERTAVARVMDGPSPGANLERWQVSGCGRTAMYLCTIPVRDCWREGEVTTATP